MLTARGYNRGVDRRVARRQLIGAMASGVATFVAACGTEASGGETRVVDDPSLGRVYQWEKDDLLVLVSGLKAAYRPGDEIVVSLTLNNQQGLPAEARVRTKLIGRGQQVVLESDVVAVTVPPDDAAHLERSLRLPRSFPPGEYTLQVELPPWTLAGGGGRSVGGGALTAPLRVDS
jgi:hypothetical protein